MKRNNKTWENELIINETTFIITYFATGIPITTRFPSLSGTSKWVLLLVATAVWIGMDRGTLYIGCKLWNETKLKYSYDCKNKVLVLFFKLY